MYGTAEALLEHIREDHSVKRWICQDCNSVQMSTEPLIFRSEQDWQAHIFDEHDTRLSEDEAPLYSNLAARVTLPSLTCPLCPSATEHPSNNTFEHVAECLHGFALWALPAYDKQHLGSEESRSSRAVTLGDDTMDDDSETYQITIIVSESDSEGTKRESSGALRYEDVSKLPSANRTVPQWLGGLPLETFTANFEFPAQDPLPARADESKITLELDREGKFVARSAYSIQAISYDLSLTGDEFIRRIADDLEPTLSSFFWKNWETYFLPWTRLHAILSTETVFLLLRATEDKGDRRSSDDNHLRTLANIIAPEIVLLGLPGRLGRQFRRALAALLTADREGDIFFFVDAGCDDLSLMDIMFGGIDMAPDIFAHLFAGWKTREIKTFRSLRWQLWPKFFSAETGLEFLSIEGELKLTDTADEDRTRNIRPPILSLRSTEEILAFERSSRREVSGGFADVNFIRLHEDQQDLPRYTVRHKFL